MDATCKTCPFSTPWKPTHAGDPRILCHHIAVVGEFTADEEPTRLETWWCSEHPLRQRDRLAAMAMQGMIGVELKENRSDTWRDFADVAYAVADAMLSRAGVSGGEGDATP